MQKETLFIFICERKYLIVRLKNVKKVVDFIFSLYLCKLNRKPYKSRIMATLVLQVPDESLVSKVKQACKMLLGVASVKVQKEAKPKKYDITKTAGFREAMDDIKHGRVYHADSVDDMFKQILGYVPN